MPRNQKGADEWDRDQYIFAISFAYTQLYIYRPSLQLLLEYLTRSPGHDIDHVLSFAKAAVLASQNIIALVGDMCHRRLLNRPIWLLPRMLFRGIITILYSTLLFSHESDQLPPLLKTLSYGKRIAEHLARRSYPSKRGRVILAVSHWNGPV